MAIKLHGLEINHMDVSHNLEIFHSWSNIYAISGRIYEFTTKQHGLQICKVCKCKFWCLVQWIWSSMWRFSQHGDWPLEDLIKFGYKGYMKIKKGKDLWTTCWLPTKTSFISLERLFSSWIYGDYIYIYNHVILDTYWQKQNRPKTHIISWSLHS